MAVLVAIPHRSSTDERFTSKARELYWAMTYADRELVMWENDMSNVAPGGKYARNAEARNEFISRFLQDHHTHVLWVDCDIVSYPSNIIELLGVYEDTAVAPSVLIEGTEQFYDYGGFVTDKGAFSTTKPYMTGETMKSVGSLYIIPAKYYHMGCRYEAVGSTVEHVRMFAQAMKLGIKIKYRPDVVAYHANLPNWGHSWH